MQYVRISSQNIDNIYSPLSGKIIEFPSELEDNSIMLAIYIGYYGDFIDIRDDRIRDVVNPVLNNFWDQDDVSLFGSQLVDTLSSNLNDNYVLFEIEHRVPYREVIDIVYDSEFERLFYEDLAKDLADSIAQADGEYWSMRWIVFNFDL